MNNERLYLSYLYEKLEKCKDDKLRKEVCEEIAKVEYSLCAKGESSGR